MSSPGKSHSLSTNTLKRLSFHGSPASPNHSANLSNANKANSNSEQKKHASKSWENVRERDIKLSVLLFGVLFFIV